MAALQDKLTAWRVRLERRLQSSQTALTQSVATSGVLTDGEYRDLLRIEDHRGLVEDLGRALRLGPRIMSGCESVAIAFAVLSCALRRWTAYLWRHIGGHLAYFLVFLLEPVILVRCCLVGVVCSRSCVKLSLWRSKVLRIGFLKLSNFVFWAIVHIAVDPTVVATVQWFLRRIWPTLAVAVRLLGSVFSILVLWLRLLAARGAILAAMRLTIAFARRQGPIVEPRIAIRAARAILGYDLGAPDYGAHGTELWVDVSPGGPLFDSPADGGIMELWGRIDAMSHINRETYAEIFGVLKCPPDEVVAAINRIARPPRPILSAVMVATGIRMGLASRLARVRSPHLRREVSRWKFFGLPSRPQNSPRRYIVLTPLNHYVNQKARIVAGKLTARMLELVLGIGDGSSIHFVFVLPVCRPNTLQAEERQQLASLIRETLAASHMPDGVSTRIMDGLCTDVSLPNLKGLPLILGLREVCKTSAGDDILALSEMNDSASWLNIPYLAAALPAQGPSFVTGRRPAIGAGKPVAGHAATRLFNCAFRFLVPGVTARDSSSVLKLGTVASMREIVNDLTHLDYSIDQDVLAMMALRGRLIEKPIEWHQARGLWGHERPASAQMASLFDLSRKAIFKRRLSALRHGEWLPLDAGFDFQAMTNDCGMVLKGHAPERNRLILLLCALRSVTKRNPSEDGGHRAFARLVPLAARLIELIGQGPLKAVLRLAEARYRDPLPLIREHLKYDVPAIVETTLVWCPAIHTPIGPSQPFLFALEQPFASLGTLRSAIAWNLRLGDPEGAADSLRTILSLQEILATHGVLDPDLKSLLDCGVFIADGAVLVKHLDFAGFLRDPSVIAAVLPTLMAKLKSMRDFRQLARMFRTAPKGRAHFIAFQDALDAFVRSVPARLAAVAATNFAAIPAAERFPFLVKSARDKREELVDNVIATAKFAAHSPIGSQPFQILMRQAAGYGSSQQLAGSSAATFPALRGVPSTVEPVFVVGCYEVCEAIESAMAKYLPASKYNVLVAETPQAMPLVNMLQDTAARAGGTRVLMLVCGRSSRMRDMLPTGCPHKALMPVLGRPLFVHALDGVQHLAHCYPGRVWLIHPDTVCIWGPSTACVNPEAGIVVPLPPDSFRLFEAYRRGDERRGARVQSAGKLLARCYLTLRTGGYSLPSLIGLSKKFALGNLTGDALCLGDAAESDFWGLVSRITALPERYRQGDVATPKPCTWFDIDEPSQLMAFYRHVRIPGFAPHFGAEAQFGGFNWENSVNIRSTVHLGGTEAKIRLRNCVFDHSRVVMDLDRHVPHAVVDGLVVANSDVRIRIAATAVRDNLLYGVTTAPGKALVLSLDSQVMGPPRQGVVSAVPLPLRAFSLDGKGNEMLRCPRIAEARPIAEQDSHELNRGPGPDVP